MKTKPKLKLNPWMMIFVILIALVGINTLFTNASTNNETISVSQFQQFKNEGKIQRAQVTPNEATTSIMIETEEGVYSVTTLSQESIVEELIQAGIEVAVAEPASSPFILNILLVLSGMVAVGLVAYLYGKQTKQNLNLNVALPIQPMMMKGEPEKEEKRSHEAKDADRKITFADIAGCEEEKEEVKEIIDFLKFPEKYKKMGASIPKGILFVGPPGTGKTLMARAIAGEADVSFFHISGSDFMEKYVGVGAQRVRDLFDEAKQKSPALIFIDEIDSIGRQRDSDANSEKDNTLNTLLVQMDGFSKNNDIVVLAATNRPDLLDKALLRPGRFDRQITIGLPDQAARKEILNLYAKNKKIAKDVDLDSIAKKTFGFSGAQLYAVLNEAAILAIRADKKGIEMEDITEAIDRVLMGPAKKSKKYNEKDKRLVAIHEAGHAVIGLCLENANKVERITIIPRGSAGGYNMLTPKEETWFTSESDMLNQIVSFLGGRAAEELEFNEVSTGASDDLKRATKIARSMITQYGMSSLGLSQLESIEASYSGSSRMSSSYSEETARQIDEEVEKILIEQYQKAKEILLKHRELLNRLADELIETDTLNSEDIQRIKETC